MKEKNEGKESFFDFLINKPLLSIIFLLILLQLYSGGSLLSYPFLLVLILTISGYVLKPIILQEESI